MNKHSCKENLKLDGEYQFDGDSVIFRGKCTECNKTLSERYDYVNTQDGNGNEVN